MKEHYAALEQRISALEGKFKGSEGDYDKNQAGNTTLPNDMEVHQPPTGKKKKLGMLVAMMKTKGKKSYA